MGTRITIDPITRIEGHLRIDVEVDGGKITNAWSSAQMWRGIEKILEGKDPRDAWAITQRFCGVCTTVHAIASIRAVENALNVEVPLNAQYIRNIIISQHNVHDSIIHFYHLSALDWVDIVSALSADPYKTAQLAQSLSNWNGNSPQAFQETKDRLQSFVNTGKLGVFGSGYWGHSAMKLPPEANLMAVNHYLAALEYQRKSAQAIAILGGKNPHIQNLCLGGVATALNFDNIATVDMERLAQLRALCAEALDFVQNVYYPDVLAVASFYKDWFSYGAGVTDYLAAPDLPLTPGMDSFDLPGGVIIDGKPNIFATQHDEYFIKNVKEETIHSWYKDSNLHPYSGETIPEYTDFNDNGKYSWCKAPRLEGRAMQVGPLAAVLTAYHAGHPRTVELVNSAASTLNIGLDKVHSTLGRHYARAARAVVHGEKCLEFIDKLIDNYGNKGDKVYVNPDAGEIPSGVYEGVGIHEAPRGILSHWLVIEDKKIRNYQAIVPSTWNSGPRDKDGNLGPYEASLLGNPVADEEKPLEVIRTVHSFDPCIACAVHTIDPDGKEIVNVKVR